MSSKCHRIVFACLWSLLLAVGLASCKPSIPSKYLQPDEMEDVLYDYHLAQSMANQEGDAAVRQSAYEKAVLNKYGITQQQFDSSLQYYIRHTEQLKTIYEDISKRYETEARLQGASESDLNQFGTIKSKGDTTDIWRGNHTLLLSHTPWLISIALSKKLIVLSIKAIVLYSAMMHNILLKKVCAMQWLYFRLPLAMIASLRKHSISIPMDVKR